MKTWKIPVYWGMIGIVNVEANTLNEAIKIAQDDEGIIQIPDNGTFLDGSWEVDCYDEDYLRKWYNFGQKDDIEYTDFCDDEEKMRDFAILTKDEFLASYSYLTEEEYDLTVKRIKEKN